MSRDLWAVLVTMALLLASVAGCSSNRSTTVSRPETTISNGPDILRGTVGQECTIRGTTPTLVSGYGLVVGLQGTGGGPYRADIEAHMLQTMARNGIGEGGLGGPVSEMSPESLLRDPNVAIVIVFAVIPPGAPQGTNFDVFVAAIDTSSTTSLEGGTLWTTELRVGPPTVSGGMATRLIGEARGSIYINPYAEPGAGDSSVTRRAGRVLDGGVVMEPLDLELVLNNPSHSRASAIVYAINSRFPEMPPDLENTARGRNAGSIALRVPHRYRDTPNEFLQMIRFLPVDNRYPRERAKRYIDALKQEPGLGAELSWCLQAIGPPATEQIRELYDHPELVPRMAALRAGARLGDTYAATHLMDLARNGPGPIRPDAIGLLADLDAGPRVDLVLKELLRDDALDVRVAAYEALASRAERAYYNRLVRQAQESAGATGPTDRELRALARTTLPPNSIQGVRRFAVENKFFLDVAPDGDPMIYITEQGTPRVVVFGGDLRVEKPMFVSIWSDRLQFTSRAPEDPVRVFYRSPGGRTVVTSAPDDLVELIRMMARRPSAVDPMPGLNLTYSEVVGALEALTRPGNGVAAQFAVERDRLKAEILAASDALTLGERPEFIGEAAPVVVLNDPARARAVAPAQTEESMVVPIEPQKPDK